MARTLKYQTNITQKVVEIISQKIENVALNNVLETSISHLPHIECHRWLGYLNLTVLVQNFSKVYTHKFVIIMYFDIYRLQQIMLKNWIIKPRRLTWRYEWMRKLALTVSAFTIGESGGVGELWRRGFGVRKEFLEWSRIVGCTFSCLKKVDWKNLRSYSTTLF